MPIFLINKKFTDRDLNILKESSGPNPTPAYSNHLASSMKFGTNPMAPTSPASSVPSFNFL
jgi:hypothetical protein